jgi:beta-1,4-mannosyltransferase
MKIIAQPAFRFRENNPYTWLLYHRMTAQVSDFSYRLSLTDHYDIFHLHWPEWELNAFRSVAKAAARLKLKLMLIDQLRKRGTKIVWTVHNLRAHEALHPRLEEWFWQGFTKRVDGYIALSDAGRVAARERFPYLQRVPGYVIPHGHYRDEYPVNESSDARNQLGISPNAKVVLFFGQIREYKNVPALVRAFRNIEDRNVILCVAGRPNPGNLAGELHWTAGTDPRIRLHLHQVPKDRVQLFFGAADLVVLPYRDILNSGSALLALSFNRPILVPGRGAMGELRSRVGPDWVQTYAGEIDTPELEKALIWAQQASRSREPRLDDLEWPQLADQTVKAYTEIISKRP